MPPLLASCLSLPPNDLASQAADHSADSRSRAAAVFSRSRRRTSIQSRRQKNSLPRSMRQLSNVPTSIISSHSMHLGVLATAWHTVNTKTSFTVYYKPRTSPSEFIIPFDQYMESVKANYSIGMRFKMRFECEEAPEQRFTGTIVG